MFACSVKFNKKRIRCAIVVAIVIVVIISTFALSITQSHEIKFNDGEDYLAACGFSFELISEDEITIPKNFTTVYEEYNQVQKEQGFDLSDYAGESCKRYTYRVTNADDDIQATFLVYNEKLIGGDIHQQQYGGWMEPLKISCF